MLAARRRWLALRGLGDGQAAPLGLRGAYIPALPAAHAWGNTQQEAFEVHLHRPGQVLPLGTLQEIIENEARWTEEDLRRLRLIN